MSRVLGDAPSNDSHERPISCLLAELRDVADWIERSKPQGLLYDSAMPSLREASAALSALEASRDDWRRDIARALLARAEWLRSEYINGGDFDHLSAREKECRWLADQIIRHRIPAKPETARHPNPSEPTP